MSSELIPIVVEMDKVAAVFGSKNGALVEQLLKKYGDELAEADELADELEGDEEDGNDEGDESARLASLLALSQMLGKAKQDLAGGKQPQKVLEGLGQSKGVSEQHQRALRDLLSDSGDAAGGSTSEHASAAEVLRSLVTGDSPGRKVAHRFLYGHVFRCLCRHLGEELAHDNWHDLRGSTWAKSLDKALKTAGCRRRRCR